MLASALQWLAIMALVGAFWVLGHFAVHVRHFGWFAALMILLAAAVVALVVHFERSRDGGTDDGSG